MAKNGEDKPLLITLPRDVLLDIKNQLEQLKYDVEFERTAHNIEKQHLRSQIQSLTEERDELRLNESKLAESNRKNEELESQLLQLQADLSSQKTEIEKHLDFYNSQLESFKETESKLEESKQKNVELEAKLLQLQITMSLERSEFRELLDSYDIIYELDEDTESKLAKNTEVTEVLRAKLHQQQNDLDLEKIETQELLNSYNSLLESAKITESKLTETTEQNELLRAKLLQLEDELSKEKMDMLEFLNLYKSQVALANENESELAETSKLNEMVEAKLLQSLEDQFSLEISALQGLLETYQMLLDFIKYTETKISETSKLTDELNVSQLLELQDELSAIIIQLLQELNSYKNELESAKAIESKLAETTKLKEELEAKLEQIENAATQVSCNEDALSMKMSATQENLSISSKQLPQKKTEGLTLVCKGMETLGQCKIFISLLKENLQDYRNQLSGRDCSKPSKNFEGDPRNLYLSSVDLQLKLNELVKKFNLDVWMKEKEINDAINGKTEEGIKLENDFVLAYKEAYKYLCDKRKITLTNQDCQDLCVELRARINGLNCNIMDLKKELEATTNEQQQYKINSEIDKIRMSIKDKEDLAKIVATIGRTCSKKKHRLRQKDILRMSVKDRKMYHFADTMRELEASRLLTDKTNTLTIADRLKIQDGLNTLINWIPMFGGKIWYNIHTQMNVLGKRLSDDPNNEEIKKHLEFLKNSEVKLNEAEMDLMELQMQRLNDETVSQMTHDIRACQDKMIEIKDELYQKSFGCLSFWDPDSLQTKLKEYGQVLETYNVPTEIIHRLYGDISKFDLEKIDLENELNRAVNEEVKIRKKLERVENEKSKFKNQFKDISQKFESLKRQLESTNTIFDDSCSNKVTESEVQYLKDKLEALEKSTASKNAEYLNMEKLYHNLKADYQKVLNVLHLGNQSSEIKNVLSQKDDQIQNLSKEKIQLKKKSQKIVDTKESEKNDLKKELKSLRTEKTKMQNTITKMKLNINKMKDKHSKEKADLEEKLKDLSLVVEEKNKVLADLEESLKDLKLVIEEKNKVLADLEESLKDLKLVVEEKNKVLADYLEIKLKYNEFNTEITSKNTQIEKLKLLVKSKEQENETLKTQLRTERGPFHPRPTQLEEQILRLQIHNNNLAQSCDKMTKSLQDRNLILRKTVAEFQTLDLKMKKLIEDNKVAELKIQRLLEDKANAELQIRMLFEDKAAAELHIRTLIEDKKKLELQVKASIEDKKMAEFQLKTSIEDKKRVELQIPRLIEDKKRAESKLKKLIQDYDKAQLQVKKLIRDNNRSELEKEKLIQDKNRYELQKEKFIKEAKIAESSRELQIRRLTEDKSELTEELKSLRKDLGLATDIVHNIEKVVFQVLDKDLSCGICSEVMVQCNILNCSHLFCEACIRDSSKLKRECPVCQAPILMQKHMPLLDAFIKALKMFIENLNQFTEKH